MNAVYKMTARKAAVRIPHIRIGGRSASGKPTSTSGCTLLTTSNLEALVEDASESPPGDPWPRFTNGASLAANFVWELTHGTGARPPAVHRRSDPRGGRGGTEAIRATGRPARRAPADDSVHGVIGQYIASTSRPTGGRAP